MHLFLYLRLTIIRQISVYKSYINLMNRQTRAASECIPRFRSTKYNTLFKKNSNLQLQQSKLKLNTQQKRLGNVQNFRKLVLSNPKRKSMPFTAEIPSNSHETYLQTFNSFMNRNYNKENRINLDVDVVLTHYKSQFDENESNFTLLDVLLKPISFIDGEMNAVEKDLKSQMYKREKLTYQLKQLQLSIYKQINEIQNQTTNGLNEFRKALKHSELFENERKLRNRKELHFLEKGYLLNRKKLQSLKDRNLQMQRTIFDCQPLQLDFHQDHSAEFKKEEYL